MFACSTTLLYHADGGGGGTTVGRSSHVIVFGSSQSASQPPSLPPRSVIENSEPVGAKWNEPQLFTPTAPTLRATTLWNDAEPAERALTTDVPLPSTLMSAKCTFVIEYKSFTEKSLTSMIALYVLSRKLSPATSTSALMLPSSA
jgi:hypothetical protein